ncbi:hypothetical protein V5N11_021622 [Cardamine amara subsp. amara]|uniref:RNA polymerase n=1 Tax=Cardamine amara subsp. amara TaxID=228776 RepID=A0ABD0ZVD0_CARAN
MGNLVMKAKEAYQDLCLKQETNLKNPSPQLMGEENIALRRWDRLQTGDKNNKMFHRAATTREAKNSIREIECSDGRILSQENDIKTEAERYFSDFLQLIPHDFEGISVEELQTLFHFRCSKEDRRKLIAMVSGEEIKRILFSMPKDQSPGPDGYTS